MSKHTPVIETEIVSAPTRNAGPDRHGFTFEELCEVQKRHLTWMEELLAPKHFAALQAFCARKTKAAIPAAWPNGCHEVPRGVELFQFLVERAQFILKDDDEIELSKDQISPRKKE